MVGAMAFTRPYVVVSLLVHAWEDYMENSQELKS
jgi:hypothetical protein